MERQQPRAHRLITRGAAVESVSPLVKVLGEVEFFSPVERIFSMPEIKGIVMEAVHAHNIFASNCANEIASVKLK